ncbi:putative Protein O-linked-mannose beta-1,2-N-acetylglucosaminyltransferase 1 [Hypsibius exemplaris]|uniref:ILEI/PANDER domain-containing protein n=1 Tax=Hypsibius exemplaris TaxID=2072580 RepID=A0A1W0X0F6_HYPEX|nr:putative Protein O-linked-mannose beta-1,2-N-acetylglucosaminyltransferase 1 [Hypsibius exemplaris]
MIRLVFPDLSRYHCNPHKNGGLKRLIVWCILVTVFVYGLQTILISKSSANVSDQSATDPTVRPRILLDSPAPGRERDAFPEDRCKVLSDTCSEPLYPYRILVGTGDNPPQICWNLQEIPLKTARPGKVTVLELSVEDGSVISEKSSPADSTKSISTILAQLMSTRNDSYIVMVTWNAVPFSPTLSNHLKSVGTLINPKFLGQGIQFYLLGQKGLLPGRGVSDVQLATASPPLDQSGCVPALATSLGNDIDHDFASSNPGYLTLGSYKVGSFLKDCGLPKPCGGELLSVHVYTGRDHNDPPKLCVNGTYVFENKINSGGRGLNIAVINGPTGEVAKVANFDTWGVDSTMLELFLEDLQPDEIAVIFTHDEASTKLSELSRTILFDLGSSRIHDLKFRASWYMVGQRGIRGFSGFEKLNIGEKTNWAEVVDERFCLPRRLTGYLSRPDPLPETRNVPRLEFCQKHIGYGDFCGPESKLAPLAPAKLADVTLVNSPIYSDLTVVLVMAPPSRNALRMLLETLLGQPGVNPRQVMVSLRKTNDSETERLIKLFNFHILSGRIELDYRTHLVHSITDVFETLHPRYIVVIEENTVLSPDFLHYLATQEPLFEVDSTINAIGAWNDNGYVGVSSDLTRVHRVDGFPHQGFLTTRSFWEANTKNGDYSCCLTESWEGWFPKQKIISVVPDVSRIARISPPAGNGGVVREMFHRPREFSRQSELKIENNFPAAKDKFDAYMASTVSKAAKFHPKTVDLCPSSLNFVETSPKELSVALMMDKEEFNERSMNLIAKCFGLFAADGARPRGVYNESISLTKNKRLVVLVGPNSPLYTPAA